jgi:hypothetical protein
LEGGARTPSVDQRVMHQEGDGRTLGSESKGDRPNHWSAVLWKVLVERRCEVDCPRGGVALADGEGDGPAGFDEEQLTVDNLNARPQERMPALYCVEGHFELTSCQHAIEFGDCADRRAGQAVEQPEIPFGWVELPRP